MFGAGIVPVRAPARFRDRPMEFGMSSANVREFTDGNFDTEVLSSNVPVLVDFWAEWCMPCRMMSPVIDAIADEQQGKLKVGKVDIDSNRDVALKYQITSIPTLIVFKNGVPVKKFVGGQRKELLAAALAETIA
jgi:thioredoxin 1